MDMFKIYLFLLLMDKYFCEQDDYYNKDDRLFFF